MLQRPPGINSEVATGQDDRGVDDSAPAAVADEVPLAMLAHPASAIEAGTVGEHFRGDGCSGTPVIHQFSGGGGCIEWRVPRYASHSRPIGSGCYARS